MGFKVRLTPYTCTSRAPTSGATEHPYMPIVAHTRRGGRCDVHDRVICGCLRTIAPASDGRLMALARGPSFRTIPSGCALRTARESRRRTRIDWGGSRSAQVAVVYFSHGGRLVTFSNVVAEGARSVEGAQVTVYRIKDPIRGDAPDLVRAPPYLLRDGGNNNGLTQPHGGTGVWHLAVRGGRIGRPRRHTSGGAGGGLPDCGGARNRRWHVRDGAALSRRAGGVPGQRLPAQGEGGCGVHQHGW